MRRSLLEQLTETPIAEPCAEPWQSMRGDVVRRCEACQRDVFDLSAMTALAAEVRLLNARDRAPCIRYARRSDGSVVHVPAASTHPMPRRVAVATALGVTLAAATLHADEPKQPAQCVAYSQPLVAMSAPAPIRAPRTASTAAAPAAAPAPAPQPPAAQPLGGAPMPAQQQPVFGTLTMNSKVSRRVTLIGIPLVAPLPSYLLTPGTFVADVVELDGARRQVSFVIKKDTTTVVDLDAPPKKRR